jgi:hypothetical protein
MFFLEKKNAVVGGQVEQSGQDTSKWRYTPADARCTHGQVMFHLTGGLVCFVFDDDGIGIQMGNSNSTGSCHAGSGLSVIKYIFDIIACVNSESHDFFKICRFNL